MKELFVLIAHLLTTLITLARPGGVREVAAESMALKLQLVVVHRTRKRAPPMTPWDRLVFGLCALWIAPSRWQKVSVVFRPSTFQRFHGHTGQVQVSATVRCERAEKARPQRT